MCNTIQSDKNMSHEDPYGIDCTDKGLVIVIQYMDLPVGTSVESASLADFFIPSGVSETSERESFSELMEDLRVLFSCLKSNQYQDVILIIL